MTTFGIFGSEQATGLWLAYPTCSKRQDATNAEGMLRSESHRGTTPQL